MELCRETLLYACVRTCTKLMLAVLRGGERNTRLDGIFVSGRDIYKLRIIQLTGVNDHSAHSFMHAFSRLVCTGLSNCSGYRGNIS